MPPTRDGDPISLPAAYDTFVTRVLLDKRPRSNKLAQGTGVEMRSVNPWARDDANRFWGAQ